MYKQAVILGLAACALVVSSWYFAAGAGVVLISAGALFGWMARHVSPSVWTGKAVVPDAAPEAVARFHALEARTSSLRHDLRGILSPAYLTAERLLNHADPMAKRAGEMMINTVERASARLNETKGI